MIKLVNYRLRSIIYFYVKGNYSQILYLYHEQVIDSQKNNTTSPHNPCYSKYP